MLKRGTLQAAIAAKEKKDKPKDTPMTESEIDALMTESWKGLLADRDEKCAHKAQCLDVFYGDKTTIGTTGIHMSAEDKEQKKSLLSPIEYVRDTDGLIKPFRLAEMEKVIAQCNMMPNLSRWLYNLPLSHSHVQAYLSMPNVRLPLFKASHIQKLLRQAGQYENEAGKKYRLLPCARLAECRAVLSAISGFNPCVSRTVTVDSPPCLGIIMNEDELAAVEKTDDYSKVDQHARRECVLCCMYNVACALVLENMCSPSTATAGSIVQPFVVLIDEPGGYHKNYQVPDGQSRSHLFGPFLQPLVSAMRWTLQPPPNQTMWMIDHSAMVFEPPHDTVIETLTPIAVTAALEMSKGADGDVVMEQKEAKSDF